MVLVVFSLVFYFSQCKQAEVSALSLLGYHATALGNHDFDSAGGGERGIPRLKTLVRRHAPHLKVLCSNVLIEQEEEEDEEAGDEGGGGGGIGGGVDNGDDKEEAMAAAYFSAEKEEAMDTDGQKERRGRREIRRRKAGVPAFEPSAVFEIPLGSGNSSNSSSSSDGAGSVEGGGIEGGGIEGGGGVLRVGVTAVMGPQAWAVTPTKLRQGYRYTDFIQAA